MGGAGLPFGLILLGLFAVVVLLGMYVVVPWLRGEARERARLTDPGLETLVYEVPEGLDPAAIVTALRSDGLQAIEVMRGGRQRIVISGPYAREELRPRAREVIAHKAHLNLEGDPISPGEVTFVDE